MDVQKDLEKWLDLIRAPGHRLAEAIRSIRGSSPETAVGPWPEQDGDLLRRLLEAPLDCEPEAIRADLRWLRASPDHHFIPIVDPRYPGLLLEIPDPPLALFVNGNPECLNAPSLSIVGSRSPTPQGRETAAGFGRRLAGSGITVVSGLARGIDRAAHEGALNTGTTVAVCAHGLDSVYPQAHRALAARIAGSGALVSEFPAGTPPRKQHFPRRNRLISGLSPGTLVVEAGLRSGSLITARLAVEQNREVFAVPGPIHSPQSRGCHKLIKTGATLVETLDDILEDIQFPIQKTKDDRPAGASDSPSQHAWFLDHMGYAPCTRDDLVNRSGLTSAEVSSMLLVLELEGCVELCPGGTYVRVTRS